MRLSSQENKTIRRILNKADPHGRIYLFGSRVDDAKKGGDIDLFFESSMTLGLKLRLALEYQLSAECDTKVDLLVKNHGQDEIPIFEIARKGILL